MTNAKRDQNYIPVRMGVLFSDGETLIPIAINADGTLRVNTWATISQAVRNVAYREENGVTVMKGVSSVDGTTVLPIFVDSGGAVLVDII